MSSSELSEQQEQQKNRCFAQLTYVVLWDIITVVMLLQDIAMRGM